MLEINSQDKIENMKRKICLYLDDKMTVVNINIDVKYAYTNAYYMQRPAVYISTNTSTHTMCKFQSILNCTGLRKKCFGTCIFWYNRFDGTNGG